MLRRLFIISFVFSITGCSHYLTMSDTRESYYYQSLEPFKILDNLKIGDSTIVHFGDTIQMKFNSGSIGGEEGNMLILRNQYNKLEYYQIGQWNYHFPKQKIRATTYFDKKYGDRQGKSYYIVEDSLLLECDHYREFRSDSLIEIQKWYYPNGNVKAEVYYQVDRGYKTDKKDWERIKRIGTWKLYKQTGELKREKRYN